MTLPEYFRRFVEWNWVQRPQNWDALTDELIAAGSSGCGNEYSSITAANLIASREQGKLPEDCGYYGA